MSNNITKDIFLKTFTCPTLGWETYYSNAVEELSIFNKFKMQEGLEVHGLARRLFPKGMFVLGDNKTTAQLTQNLLNHKNTEEIFEATFIADNFITKVDILKKENKGWHLIEIKSGTDPENSEYLDDLAYTTMVVKMTGINIVSSSLLLVSKDYRLGMPESNLFKEYDCSDKIVEIEKVFRRNSKDISKYFKINKKAKPNFIMECKGCGIFENCHGEDFKNHILELPRISSTKFRQLKHLGVLKIKDIPADFKLTDTQIHVYKAVKSNKPFINDKGLKLALSKIEYPAHYLDFETVMTAIPLYKDIAPYEQIPTQYSLHKCSSVGKISEHFEFLSDSSKDCRRELAESLIRDCGHEGSIFSYSHFEKDVINWLKNIFPDLEKKLDALINRIVDLCAVFQKYYYHPEFHGSYSIKGVLPVMVGDLSYKGMEVNNGSDAIAVFAKMARGEYSQKECKAIKQHLLEYCKLDTLAMVRLHWKLIEAVN